MTPSLLQNTRTIAREITFGDPSANVFLANALVDKMKDGGHDVMVVTKGFSEMLTMLERFVLSDKMRKNKATGKLMTRQEKIDYITKWKIKNKHILKEGGLLVPRRGDAALLTTPLKILCGIFFSISTAQMVVPHLWRVFQADACHMNFGKYTLYSCYGTTANCNTFPVAFAILFGNEDKDGWVQFWESTKSLHPSLDRFDTTIITDQAKGLKEAIYQVLPDAVHFHCSFHRRQNIAKIVWGGNVKYFCLWLFNKLVKAHTKQEIKHIKHKHSGYVDKKALKYLNTLDNKEVYPGARCELGGRIFMYQQSASLAVESMNWANKAACARTAVDVVFPPIFLIFLGGGRPNFSQLLKHP
jgi:hypothetical protein